MCEIPNLLLGNVWNYSNWSVLKDPSSLMIATALFTVYYSVLYRNKAWEAHGQQLKCQIFAAVGSENNYSHLSASLLQHNYFKLSGSERRQLKFVYFEYLWLFLIHLLITAFYLYPVTGSCSLNTDQRPLLPRKDLHRGRTEWRRVDPTCAIR